MVSIYLVVQICLSGYCGNYAVESYTQQEAAQCLADAKTVQGAWCEMDGMPDGE